MSPRHTASPRCKKTESPEGLKERVASRLALVEAHVRQQIGEWSYLVSPDAFFQTNARAAAVLQRLQQEGWIAAEWGVSDNNRKAKFYKLTRSGRKQLERETKEWNQTTAIVARFLTPVEDES